MLSRVLTPIQALDSTLSVTYLQQTAGLKNISVLLVAHATKIVLETSTQGLQIAKALQFTANNKSFAISATKEVILSTGTYHTPQLLELSGIGDPKILAKFGIAVKVDLPQVG